MKHEIALILEELFSRYHQLSVCKGDIEEALDILIQSYYNGGKVLICGNGGSAADSEHIVGELMKGFILKRRIGNASIQKIKEALPKDWEYLSNNLQGALPAISLTSQSAISSAFINDVQPDMVFAQQVYGYGKEGDVVIGLSTSGNSKNVINAIKIAKAFGMKTVGLTGQQGGLMGPLCDVTIKVPAIETFKVQEYHLPIYHALCASIEQEFFVDE